MWKENRLLKFFYDPECKQELLEIDFGEVEVGKERESIFWIKNVALDRVSKIEDVESEDALEILEFPKSLDSGETQRARIRWRVSPKLVAVLKGNIRIKEKEVWK